MRSKFSYYMSVLWIAVMLAVGIAILVIAPKGKLQSETEKRYLQELPTPSLETIASGEFTEDFESFMSDKFFERDRIIRFASEVESLFSIVDFDDILEYGEGAQDSFVDENLKEEDLSSGVEDENEESIVGEDSIEADKTEQEEALSGEFPYMLSIWAEENNGERKRLFEVSQKDVNKTVDIVNRLNDIVPEDGRIYYLSVLQALTANRYIRNLSTYAKWDNNIDAYMRTKVKEKVNVLSITELLQEPIRNGEYVYFRTDTHWTPQGAYYAYREIISSQGIEPVPYEAYTFDSLDNFLGTYYDLYQQSAMKNNADRLDIINPLIPVKYYVYTGKDEYREIPVTDRTKGIKHEIYLGGNIRGLTVLRSEAGTGRKALMLKDSFGLIPSVYLSAHYDEIYIIDPRFYNSKQVESSVKQLIQEKGIEDVLIFVSDINGHGKDFTNIYMNRLLKE